MTAKKNPFILLLIIVLCTNLLNVQVVLADGETPTEPPAATEAATESPTELPVELTPVPIESTPMAEDALATPLEIAPTAELLDEEPQTEEVDEAASVAVILSEVPEDTNVVVLNAEGQQLPLSSQEAADALVASDPVWCPASVTVPTPGAGNCSISYGSINELIDAMRNNPSAFDEDGTIFLEKPAGQGFTTPLILDDSASSLGGSFATLSTFNLAIQGGWNGNNPGTFAGQTQFGASGGSEGYILIGSATNPWAGNITLSSLLISGISSANAVTVYTTSGNIALLNVDVANQTGTNYTGYLQSNSGNISVGNTSYFDGNNNGTARNKGFYAETKTGSISITGTGSSPTFQDARGTDPANYNGATLNAPTVTLTNVISEDNDGNGIAILNANVVTLNNVISGMTKNGQPDGNGLSGVLVNGTGTTTVIINGGSFSFNGRYGIEILSSGTISVLSNPSFSGNALGGLFEDTAPNTSITSNPPSLTNDSTASFSFTGNDNFTSPANLTFQCSRDGAIFIPCTSPIGYAGLLEGSHNFQVRAVDQSGTTDLSPASFSWAIDATPPIISPHGNETVEATSSAGAVVKYTAPTTTDAVDGPGVATCSPASGTTFSIGNTIVTCTAVDAVKNVATPIQFVVHVVDTTAPDLNLPSNITTNATGPSGVVVNFTVSAYDIVDGSVGISCNPASGSTFALGTTTVNCSSTDGAGNTTTGSFLVMVNAASIPTDTPISTPISPSPTNPSEGSSNSNTTTSLIVPLTGGVIDLDCNTTFSMFGIQLTFLNLCDQQAAVQNVPVGKLPGKLPQGFSFLMGLDVKVLSSGQALQVLPNGSGIQMDFPISREDQFAVLYWNGSSWIEISQQLSEDKVSQVVGSSVDNNLYQIQSTSDAFYKILTTEKTGTFVLVKK